MTSSDEGSFPSLMAATPAGLDAFRASILSSMQTTARCRFIAAGRLEKRDRGITQVTAFASAYLIVLSALNYFLKLPSDVSAHINLASLGMTVIVLVSSLLQYSNSDAVKAEQYNRSALEIDELKRRFLAFNDTSKPDYLNEIAIEYSRVLQRYGINHSHIDYIRLQTLRPEEFSWVGGLALIYYRAYFVVVTRLPNLILVAVTAAFLAILLGYAIPAELK